MSYSIHIIFFRWWRAQSNPILQRDKKDKKRRYHVLHKQRSAKWFCLFFIRLFIEYLRIIIVYIYINLVFVFIFMIISSTKITSLIVFYTQYFLIIIISFHLKKCFWWLYFKTKKILFLFDFSLHTSFIVFVDILNQCVAYMI